LRLRSCIQGEILSPAGFDTPLLQDGTIGISEIMSRSKLFPYSGEEYSLAGSHLTVASQNSRGWMRPTMPVHEISSFSL
jgi:hypothetical protein